MKKGIVKVCKYCKTKFLSEDGSENFCGCMSSEEKSLVDFHEEMEEQGRNRREYIAERKLTTDDFWVEDPNTVELNGRYL